ncbi:MULTISPECIES: glycoside hydrolase family 26 protein [Paracoccaceae]|jgi:endoglucanase|uniref:glycoside hydrolase family 26 protein n=1 Tax=Rhodobacterales TaxID=204455 RepID=UPI001B15FD33|nr:glycosyl hydrolase [Boseongicola sp. H5]MBO6602094.1 beta-mannosidase [Roseicyclus sp.]MBO6626351.1 beta-mannosidase [Roseicyclus sp.]MBO6923864.1 beta-mannosidase [Roseicyclus sp.]
MTYPKSTDLSNRTWPWVATLGVILGAVTPMAFAAPPGDLPFGVYDPNGEFTDDPDVQIEHLFLPWEDVFLPSLDLADIYARDRNRSVLVTIEPWTWTRDERNSPEVLIAGINEGAYDENMATICAVLNTFSSPVTVRWGQEMEDRSGQFIWAAWEPEVFIAAYQRMVTVCRAAAQDIDYMWSPLGLTGFENYYPGDDYVDVVGLSVFGLQAWEQEILGEEQRFRDILAPRYERALQFGKPIVVAELGFRGDVEYVTRWMNDVRQDIADFPALEAVIYFNQTEVYPWPDDFGLPDWRFSQHVVE